MSLNRLCPSFSRLLAVLAGPALAAVVTCAGALAQTPQSMSTAHRTSGVAPLAVTFDAIGSGSGVVQPPGGVSPNAYEYLWEFGDPGAGWWPIAMKPRNRAIGYLASHVYETPGTYVATLRVIEPNGTERQYQQWIDVQDPEVVYSGRTYYVSNSGNDSNPGTSPSQAFRTINHAWSMLMASNGPRRLLLHRGEMFQATSGLGAGTRNGPYSVATYGFGDRPKVRFSHGGSGLGTDNVNDLRVQDIDFLGPHPSGSTSGTGYLLGSNSLLQRCLIRGFDYGIGCYYGTNHSGNTIYECSILDNRTYGFYGWSLDKLAVLGNHFDNSGNNSLLRTYSGRTVISANFLQRAGQSAFRTLGRAQNDPTEYVCVTDNAIMSNTPWVYEIGPENQESAQFIKHVMVERNAFWNRGSSAVVLVFGEEVAVRNNVFDLDGANAVQVNRRGIGPTPRGVLIDNNTAYQASSNNLRLASVVSADVTPVRNNIVYNAVGTETVVTGSAAPANNFTADPGFLNVWCADMRLNWWSGAIGTGMSGIVRHDFLGNPRHPNATDIGAYERW